MPGPHHVPPRLSPALDRAILRDSQLVLPPLSAQDSRRLLRALLPTAAIPESLAQRLLDRAQGNPFFLEELVQTLVEHDVVGQADASGVTGRSPHLSTVQLPSTVQEVRAARLDRLPPAEKALLQTLAVLGRTVPWRLLTQVVGQPEAALHQPLEALQAAEFLYEQPSHAKSVKHYGQRLEICSSLSHKPMVLFGFSLSHHA